jgi:hypothetical protein
MIEPVLRQTFAYRRRNGDTIAAQAQFLVLPTTAPARWGGSQCRTTVTMSPPSYG